MRSIHLSITGRWLVGGILQRELLLSGRIILRWRVWTKHELRSSGLLGCGTIMRRRS
jgi:hypothetical protein